MMRAVLTWLGFAAAVLISTSIAVAQPNIAGIRTDRFGARELREPVATASALPVCDAASLWHARLVIDEQLWYLCGAGAVWTAMDAAATGIDYDRDGSEEVSADGSTIGFDPDDTGTPALFVGLNSGGDSYISHGSANGAALKFQDVDNVIFLCRSEAGGANPMQCPIQIKPYNLFDLQSGTSLSLSTTARMFFGGTAVGPSLRWTATNELTLDDGSGGSAKWIVVGVERVEPQAVAPASCTLGDMYIDSSGAECKCQSNNSWLLVHNLSAGGTPNCT